LFSETNTLKTMRSLMLVAALSVTAGGSLVAQSAADSVRKANARASVPLVDTGIASYYHSKFTGRPTASGEKYDPEKMTAAHNRLPLGTRIRVTNLRNKRSVIVRVNDRLHYRNTRLVDL